MTALAAEPPEARRAYAARLWAASAAVLACMPAVMAAAHRSSPLVITLAAALALAAAAAEGSLGALLDRARAALAVPLGRAALAFLALSAASLAWSPDPADSAHALGEFVLPLGAALVLALALPGRVPSRRIWLLAGLSALACISVVIELKTGMALRRSLGMRWNSFVLNRPVLTLLVLAPPALWFIARSGGRAEIAAAAGLAALLAAAIGSSESGAAAFGLAGGAAAWAASRILPRLSLALAAVGVALALAAAPAIGPIADRLIPPSAHKTLAESHSSSRVEIWKSFGAAIREAPLLGSGFGSSGRLDRAPVAERVSPDRRVLLGAGHPHNAALQVWAELGASGAVLAGIVLLLMLRSLAGLPAADLGPRLALFAAVALVSLVGHGAWQGWWAAGIGAAIVWFRVAAARE